MPKVIWSYKINIYDEIAGSSFGKYDDNVLKFGENMHDFIRKLYFKYNYLFTNQHSVSWLEPIVPRYSYNLIYKPTNKYEFYVFNELFKKYNIKILDDKEFTVAQMGNGWGLLEYVAHKKIDNKNMTYIVPEHIGNAQKILNDMSYKLKCQVLELRDPIYNYLDMNITPANIYAYTNFEYVRHFQLNFSHINIINNLVGIISGLFYTKKGGIFIIHMNSIINKTHADIYLLAQTYFEESYLYCPEVSNLAKQSGTWAIFKGFNGITQDVKLELIKLLEDVKMNYPNGMKDSEIYEPEVRKLCFAKLNPINVDIKDRIPYINGFFSELTLDNDIYKPIIKFNNDLYSQKLEFTNELLLPLGNTEKLQQEQTKKSIEYFDKWGIKYIMIPDKINKPINQYTYFIASDSFNPGFIEKEMDFRGIWKQTKNKDYADFVYMDDFFEDTSLYSIKSKLKSLVGDKKREITYKDVMFKNLLKIPGASNFLPKTIPFSIKETTPKYLERFKQFFKKGRPYICKMVMGGAGLNIILTDNYKTFYDFMYKYYAKMRNNPKFKQFDWVLQEYIINPLLAYKKDDTNGYKFHIRQIMLYNPQKPSYNMYQGRMALANKPYVAGDWLNKDIHDTHLHGKHGLYWPYSINLSLEARDKIYNQIDFIYSCLLEVVGNTGCYKETQNCFEMFGVDLLITNDYRVYLLEVNTKIAVSNDKQFNGEIFNAIMYYIVDDYFKPLYRQEPSLAFFPIKPYKKLLKPYLQNINSFKRTQKRAHSYYSYKNTQKEKRKVL